MSQARWLSFFWSPERQEIACDGERFAHPVATNTSCSHDVAHLLVAASGLPWKPKGSRDAPYFAEFNAVLVEHLAVRVLDAVVLGCGDGGEPLEETLEHARWFVETHYAPFPVGFDEALARFCRGLDAEVVLRLSPVLFRTRVFEIQNPGFRSRTLQGAFSSCFEPKPCAQFEAARGALTRTLEALLAASARVQAIPRESTGDREIVVDRVGTAR